MRKFWGFYENGTYKVGCNGATMYLYDSENHELAKFKDIAYAYCGAFQPNSNIFVLRSTEGRLAVYDCDERKLLHKFNFSNVRYSQNDGFCFSPDGQYFYNIERFHTDFTITRLSIYETKSFSPLKRLLDDDPYLVLSNIEYHKNQDLYYLLCFDRDEDRIFDYGFICTLNDERLTNFQLLRKKEFKFLRSYKSLQESGFTEKAMTWSGLHYDGYTNEEILRLRDRNIDMASFPQIAAEVVK